MAKPNGHSRATEELMIQRVAEQQSMAAFEQRAHLEAVREARGKMTSNAVALLSRFELDDWKNPSVLKFCALTAYRMIQAVDETCDEQAKKQVEVAKAVAEKPLITET